MYPPKLGNFIQPNGDVQFRVWAPHASEVKVAGDFNSWDQGQPYYMQLINGYWETQIHGLPPGAQYKYKLMRKDGVWKWRLDPAARDTMDSSEVNMHNNCYVVDSYFDWSSFTTPAFDDFIIYQCHIGSFCGRNDGLTAKDQVANINDLVYKLIYIRDLGFNAIELLPMQEFRFDRSWGYNPALYFAPESAYGSPADFRFFVDQCHAHGLAVIFDVVYNHISNDDSSFWHFDEDSDDNDRDSYLSTFNTPWGLAPAFWKQGIRDFFLENMRMYFEEYHADGLRFDATRMIEANRGLGNDGWEFMQYLTFRGKELFPGKYLIAEHVPAHESIIYSAGFHATWVREVYDRCFSALNGNDTLNTLLSITGCYLGDGQNYPYNSSTIRYLLGSHDECGDMNDGNNNHRYYVQLFGGRDNWYARAKCRLAWGLNIAIQGTPMMFMGSEYHQGGYWDDGSDANGDHRFDWSVADDAIGMEMRRFVGAANQVRLDHDALRSGSLEVTHRDDRGIFAIRRWNYKGDVVLIVVNASDSNFTNHSYGVSAGQRGQWRQFLCSQDTTFGGWDGAGNAYYDAYTDENGIIYINLPQWSVVMFKLI